MSVWFSSSCIFLLCNTYHCWNSTVFVVLLSVYIYPYVAETPWQKRMYLFFLMAPATNLRILEFHAYNKYMHLRGVSAAPCKQPTPILHPDVIICIHCTCDILTQRVIFHYPELHHCISTGSPSFSCAATQVWPLLVQGQVSRSSYPSTLWTQYL